MGDAKGKEGWRISTHDRSLSHAAAEGLTNRKQSAAMLTIIETAVKAVSSAKFTEVQSSRGVARSTETGRFFPNRWGATGPSNKRA